MQLLARLAGVEIKATHGLVLANIPAGWNAVMIGKSANALFLNSANLPVSAHAVTEARSFVAMNVEVGGHFLKVSSNVGSDTAVIGVPVLAGSMTYIDVSSISPVQLKGRILDGSSRVGKAIEAGTIRVLEDGEHFTATDAMGNFDLGRIQTVLDHPILIETQAKNAQGLTGMPQRFQLSPSTARKGRVVLFHLAQVQVDEWLGQLEGGISPNSAVVVGAVPSLARGLPGAMLQPKSRA